MTNVNDDRIDCQLVLVNNTILLEEMVITQFKSINFFVYFRLILRKLAPLLA